MSPAWLGRPTARTTPLFWDWRGKDTPRDCWPRWAVRDGDWKLVTYHRIEPGTDFPQTNKEPVARW